jgi:hypothetical protein
MSYHFNDIIEFKEFVSGSFERGDYTQEIENFNKGINTIPNDKQGWDWVEGEKLYLAKSGAGNLFILYQHPGKGFEQYIWMLSLWHGSKFSKFSNKMMSAYPLFKYNYRTWNMGSFEKSWVIEYLVMDSHPYSLSFMNWINENPFEIK